MHVCWFVDKGLAEVDFLTVYQAGRVDNCEISFYCYQASDRRWEWQAYMWKIFNDHNAVEAAALTIRFGEPVNTLVSKRVIRELESVARQQGFAERQPLQTIQVDVDAKEVRQGSATGIALRHTAVKRNYYGIVEPALYRQIIFQPEQLVLQINEYRTWIKEWDSAKKIFEPILDLITAVVPVQGIRLEYLNRFVYEGAQEEAVAADFMKRSEFVSDIGLSSPNLWHSHNGRFDQETDSSRRLVQINADMQDLTSNQRVGGHRSLALMLAVERQFLGNGMVVEDEKAILKIEECFTSLHDDIHSLFKQLIDSTFASANGMPA